MSRSASPIAAEIAALGPWFQNMELHGIATAPNHFLGDYPRIKWESFSHCIQADLTDQSVLDIGCNAGFYSIEMKKRGARRVLGIDSDEDYLAQARFAARVSGQDIEFRALSVYEIGALDEEFDLVLFMGVLYHLRYPLLALDLIRQVKGCRMMVFQSMLRGSDGIAPIKRDYAFEEKAHFDEPGAPKLFFVEHDYSHDPTNWWIPNSACAEAMLRSAGFTIIAHPEAEIYLCVPDQGGHPVNFSIRA